MGSRRWGGVLAALGAVALAAFAIPAVPDLVRGLLGAALALCLPGAALTAALLPDPSIGRPVRLMTSVGLSIALLGLVAIALHAAGIELRAAAWGSTLAAITLIGGGIAMVRGPYRTPEGASGSDEPSPEVLRRLGIGPDPGFVASLRSGRLRQPMARFAIAGALTIAALGVAAFGAMAQPSATFTELWMLPYPGTDDVAVGVRNLEDGPRSYDLRVQAGQRVVGSWDALELAPGETWAARISLPPLTRATADVRAQLSLADGPRTPYREVRLWRGEPASGRQP